jgi:hypothetical protein
MQDLVTVATDFLRVRRQFFDTPIKQGEANKALVTLGQMQALARVLGVDLDTMHPPDAHHRPEPIEQVTLTPLPDYDMVLLTVPANDLPGYETPQWSAFLHQSTIIPLLKSLLTILQQQRKSGRSPCHTLRSLHMPHGNDTNGHDGPGAA